MNPVKVRPTTRPCEVCGLSDGQVKEYGGVPMHESVGLCISSLKDELEHSKDELKAQQYSKARLESLWKKVYPDKPMPTGLTNIVYLSASIEELERTLGRVTKEKEKLAERLDAQSKESWYKERRYKRQEMLVSLMREEAQHAALTGKMLDPKDIIGTFRRADLALEAEEESAA